MVVGQASVQPLGWARSIGYGSGNFGKNVLWHSADVILLFMFTETLGVAPGVAGLILLSSVLFDAALDPLIALCAERCHSRFGQYTSFMVVGAPLAGISFALLLSAPLLGFQHFAWILFFLFLFRFGYTLIDIAHNTMMALITEDPIERSRISVLRFFFSSLASLALAISIFPLLQSRGAFSLQGLAAFGCAAAGSSTLVLALSWSSVLRWDRRLGIDPAGLALPLRDLIRHVMGNGALLRALGIALLTALTLPLLGKTFLYLSVYVLNDPSAAPRALTAMVAGQFFGLPVWHMVAARFRDVAALKMAYTGLALLGTVFFWSVSQDSRLLIPLAFGLGCASSGAYSLIWSLFAGSVDVARRAGVVGFEATAFGLATFTLKAGIGIGTGILGLTLSAAGLDEASGQISFPGFLSLGAAYLPALGSLGCLWLLRSYGVGSLIRDETSS